MQPTTGDLLLRCTLQERSLVRLTSQVEEKDAQLQAKIAELSRVQVASQLHRDDHQRLTDQLDIARQHLARQTDQLQDAQRLMASFRSDLRDAQANLLTTQNSLAISLATQQQLQNQLQQLPPPAVSASGAEVCAFCMALPPSALLLCCNVLRVCDGCMQGELDSGRGACWHCRQTPFTAKNVIFSIKK